MYSTDVFYEASRRKQSAGRFGPFLVGYKNYMSLKRLINQKVISEANIILLKHKKETIYLSKFCIADFLIYDKYCLM
jgi:hypothetical protein